MRRMYKQNRKANTVYRYVISDIYVLYIYIYVYKDTVLYVWENIDQIHLHKNMQLFWISPGVPPELW